MWKFISFVTLLVIAPQFHNLEDLSLKVICSLQPKNGARLCSDIFPGYKFREQQWIGWLWQRMERMLIVSATNPPEIPGSWHWHKIPSESLSYPHPGINSFLPFSSLPSPTSSPPALFLYLLHKTTKVCFCYLQPLRNWMWYLLKIIQLCVLSAEIWSES